MVAITYERRESRPTAASHSFICRELRPSTREACERLRSNGSIAYTLRGLTGSRDRGALAGLAGVNVPAAKMPQKHKPVASNSRGPDVARKNMTVSPFGPDGEIRQFCQIEADIIEYAMRRYQGKASEVARRLKIGRSTLSRRLERYEDVKRRSVTSDLSLDTLFQSAA